MKVWLNDLKEGDIFYLPSTILQNVLKCEHLGDAHNMNFRMSRIKFKILEGCDKDINEVLGEDNELFVNQYVYTDYDSAHEILIDKLKKELENEENSIKEYNRMSMICSKRIESIRKTLEENNG